VPGFPSIRANGSADTLNGYVNTTLLVLNKIYYNKRVHKQNIKRVDPNTFDEVTEQE